MARCWILMTVLFSIICISQKTDLQNHKGYNGVIFDDREKSPQLMNYDFDGSKIVIYKVDNGRFLDGDFTVKSISDDHLILHFMVMMHQLKYLT